MVAGDLMDEFQAELDRISAEDPELGGEEIPSQGPDILDPWSPQR